MAIHLGRSLPNASRDRPERRRESPPGTVLRPCLPLLLGLAPGGVFPAIAITGDAVRSYRTISPLPRLRGGGWRCVSVALSLGSPPPAVNRHRAFRGARTFLSPHCCEKRPSDRLAWDGMGQPWLTVKIARCQVVPQFELRLWGQKPKLRCAKAMTRLRRERPIISKGRSTGSRLAVSGQLTYPDGAGLTVSGK